MRSLGLFAGDCCADSHDVESQPRLGPVPETNGSQLAAVLVHPRALDPKLDRERGGVYKTTAQPLAVPSHQLRDATRNCIYPQRVDPSRRERGGVAVVALAHAWY